MTSSKTTQSIDNTILTGVLSLLDDQNKWTGTMTALNSKLARILGKSTTLPQSPSALRMVLNRIQNRLRSRGVSVQFGRTANTRYVKFVY